TNLEQTKSYTAGATSVAIDDIVVTDPDPGETITANLTLATPTAGAITGTDGGATYNATTGLWTVTGSVATVNPALASVAFAPAAGNTVDTSISVQIRDSAGTGPSGSIDLDVTSQGPTATNLTQTQSYATGTSSVGLDDIVVSDTD